VLKEYREYFYGLYSSIVPTVDRLGRQFKKQKEVLKVHNKNNLKVLRKQDSEKAYYDIENSREKN
jgi:hypothetical protein